MGINVIKEEIKIIIETLHEQFAIIDEHKGRIPQLEMDIIMSNIRKLYEYFYELNKLNTLKKNEEMLAGAIKRVPEPDNTELLSGEVPQAQMQDENPVAPELVTESPLKPQYESTTMEPPIESPQIQSPPPDPAEILKDIASDPEPPAKPETSMPKKEVKKAGKHGPSGRPDLFSFTEKETLADKFKESGNSVHHKLTSEKAEKTVAEKISKGSLTDLRSAIGINDKFLFINELFRGDMQEYNKTIDKLNHFNLPAPALEYLEEVKSQFGWDENGPACQKLAELLKRKHNV